MKTKRTNWLLIGAAALAMGACSDEEFMVEEGTENGKKLFTFEATMDADTRTTFNADYSNLTWAEGDKLRLFTDAGDISSANYVGGNRFKASLSSEASGVYAIYPYNSIEERGRYNNMYIPHKQLQEKAGVLNGENVLMSAQADLSSGLTSLKFKPLASLMAFNVYHSNDGIVDRLKTVSYLKNTLGGYWYVTGAILSKLVMGDHTYFYGVGDVEDGHTSGSVCLATPYEIPRNKPNDKSGLVYLAVKPETYTSGGTVIVTTDENKAYYFTMKESLDLEDPYKTQTIAIDLEKAERVETLDNLNSRFDDSNFLQFLLENYDVNFDGKLSSFEVALVNAMNCSELSIQSLRGIELFTNMEYLSCNDNQLTSLDLGGCAGLRVLSCYFNQLTSLDVSGCTKLENLYCSYNQLQSLDVSSCTGLTNLDCRKNQLTSLDISGCTGLTELRCESNQLTSLDVSGCTRLQWLLCDSNQLTSLDVSGFTRLRWLKCTGNQLTSLDVSSCTGLELFECGGNQLTSLDVSSCTGLTTRLSCGGNQLTSLDVSSCTGLTELYCESNLLTSLNVNGCTGLTELYCEHNGLTSLDVSGCTGLTDLDCRENYLTSLDVSGCAKHMGFVGASKQFDYVRDAEGNVVTDEYGNKIPIHFKFYKAANQTIDNLHLQQNGLTEIIEK